MGESCTSDEDCDAGLVCSLGVDGLRAWLDDHAFTCQIPCATNDDCGGYGESCRWCSEGVVSGSDDGVHFCVFEGRK